MTLVLKSTHGTVWLQQSVCWNWCHPVKSLELLGFLQPGPPGTAWSSAMCSSQAQCLDRNLSKNGWADTKLQLPSAFLWSVLFGALCQGRVDKPGLFAKGLLLCYLYFRKKKKILKTVESVEVDSSIPPFTKTLIFLAFSTLLLCTGAETY